eukprot:5973058-Prymnesium_polylepis.1
MEQLAPKALSDWFVSGSVPESHCSGAVTRPSPQTGVLGLRQPKISTWRERNATSSFPQPEAPSSAT